MVTTMISNKLLKIKSNMELEIHSINNIREPGSKPTMLRWPIGHKRGNQADTK